MPQPPAGSPVNAKLQTAKNVLAGAKNFSKQADPTGALAPKPMGPKPNRLAPQDAPSAGPSVQEQNRKAAAEEGAKVGMKAMPIMHNGGTVEKTGPAYLQKGEEVISAKNGRASEYRKVYLGRKQKKSAGE